MSAGQMFDRARLIEAFEAIAAAAVANRTRLELVVYGGSALMLASNFRFARDRPRHRRADGPVLLALKLKAMRILDPVKGRQEADDIRNLMRLQDLDVEDAMAILAKYFPRSAADGAKRRFLLKRLDPATTTEDRDAPRYGR